ncbi:BTAD domain-containing putative transcriptional regulator [Amycolatopsis lurida]
MSGPAGGTSVPVEFRLLGPVDVLIGGRRRDLGGPRQARLLALLLLNEGRAVTADAVVDALWDGDPPGTARRQVHNAIAALRRGLGEARSLLVTEPAGYRVALAGCRIDAVVFETAVEEAKRRYAGDDPAGAAEVLISALALWRGPALEGLGGPVFTAAAARLDEHRLLARELLLDCRLDGGEADALLPELTQLVAASPLREGLHGRLMLALYRAGRQADALAAYQRARQVLDLELGVEPGPALRELHQRILRSEVPVTAGSRRSTTPTLSTLPYAVSDFTGRSDALATLLRGSRNDHGVSITVVAGMAGVGKTTLAVRAAHALAGSYPDGCVFLDLQGYTPGAVPLDSDSALEILLRTVGVPADRIPEPGPLRVNRWRSEVADRRLLLVFDNARDAAQIRPLIPGGSGSRVLVTSRTTLPALEGAGTLFVEVLPREEAEALFRRVVDDERAVVDPALVSAVVEVCGGLPLAVRIAAARLRSSPRGNWPSLVDRLRTHRRGLAELVVDDLSVQSAFAVSYQDLDEGTRRAFRLLGVHPGPDIGLHAAAALLDLPATDAEKVLGELVHASLLAQQGRDRYRLHDLLRDYAGNLEDWADPDTPAAARGRLGDYYLALGRASEALLDPGLELAPTVPAPSTELPPLASAKDVREVMAAEHRSFVAVVAADAAEPGPRSSELATTLGTCLLRHGHTEDALEAFRRGLDAAITRDERTAQAVLYRHLGVAYLSLGRFTEALTELRLGLAVAARIGDQLAEGRLHGNLGIVRMRQGDNAEAEDHLRRARALLFENGTARDRAAVLTNLGLVLTRTGRYTEAAEHHRQAQVISTELGNLRVATSSLINVGWNAMLSGDLGTARERLVRSLELSREIGAKGDEVRALSLLADCLLRSGELAAAREHAEVALRLARALANPDIEGRVLEVLGRLHEQRGDPARAGECYRNLLTVATSSGHRDRGELARTGLRRVLG